MHSAFINIAGVPTKVTTWGKWIEEAFTESDCRDIVLMVCGNPGITTFYHMFLERLHQITGHNVWVLSHAGHELPQEPTVLALPELDDNEELYNLDGQVKHKVAFIRQYVPSHCCLHLIGHSIGAYMCSQALRDTVVRQQTTVAYLLFPTLEEMAATRNGRFYTQVMQRLRLPLMFLAYFFALWPECLQTTFARFVLWISGISSDFVMSVLTLAQPKVARNVMFLADDEMATVRQLDHGVLRNNKDRIVVLYAKNDGWAPQEMCRRMVSNIEGIRAEVVREDFEHAFVLKHSKEVAAFLSDHLLQA